MKMLFSLSLLLVLAAVCLAGPVTTLDTPVTITGGFLDAVGPGHAWLLVADGPPSFSLSGAQSGSFLGGMWIGPAGEPVNVSGIALDIWAGSGMIDGISYAILKNDIWGPQSTYYGTFFSFSALPVTAAPGTFEFPFTFSGYISAGLLQSFDCILCEVPIEGSGIGTITFSEVVGHPGHVQSRSMIYRFDVPEPGSAWLLAAGILTAAFAAQVRRIRRH